MSEIDIEIMNKDLPIDKEKKSISKCSKTRAFFQKILNSKNLDDIKINECKKDGDISFIIKRENMGLSPDDLNNNKPQIFNEFFANFIGEILVRENIDEFAKIIISNKEDYNDIVNQFEHKKFGMSYSNNVFLFSFHISLIQKILTEDIKRQIDYIKNN